MFYRVHKWVLIGVASVLISCGGGSSSSAPAASSKAASSTPVVSSVAASSISSASSVALSSTASSASAHAVHIVANGDNSSDARPVFYAALGNNAVDDQHCREAQTINRLTEVVDNTLQRYVFAFMLKRDEDVDCAADSTGSTDRQRLEVKVYSDSPESLKGREGEIHYYRWKLLLPTDMQVSTKFTHVFQIIGNVKNTQPLITLTVFKFSDQKSQQFELRYYPPDGDMEYLKRLNLNEIAGRWLDINLKVHYAVDGAIEINITDMANQKVLVNLAISNLHLFRTGTEFNRPKWGIYRSLEEKNKLRDETLWMTDFCLSDEGGACW